MGSLDGDPQRLMVAQAASGAELEAIHFEPLEGIGGRGEEASSRRVVLAAVVILDTEHRVRIVGSHDGQNSAVFAFYSPL